MTIEPAKIAEIREKFARLESRWDLLALMNLVKPLVFDGKAFPFKLNQLTWFASPKLHAKGYHEFTIRKKSGSARKIHAPVDGLKSIQKALSIILQCVCETHPAATGFVMGRSIVDNASIHVGNNYVYNIDLKDFFPSIDQARVWKCLQLKPFDLVKKDEVSGVIDEKPNLLRLLALSKSLKVSRKDATGKISFSESKGALRSGKYSFKLPTGEKIVYRVIDEKNGEFVDVSMVVDETAVEGAKRIIMGVSENKIPNLRRFSITYLIMLAVNHQISLFGRDHRGALANLIASLCCTEMLVERMNEEGEWIKVRRNVLPQGAPTSPVLTNIVCRKLDHRLSGIAKRFGLRYSRYADDITFSSMHNVYQTEGEFVSEVRRVIEEQGFHIKESKTRLQKDGHRKEVTGLLVNERVNVPKRYVKQLRMWLHYWEIYGYEKASTLFSMDYIRDKGHVNQGNVSMLNVIEGKLMYLRMIRGKDDKTYNSLHERFIALAENNIGINAILNTWEKEGIERAIERYLNPDQTA